MPAQNFNSAPELPENWGFSSKFCIYGQIFRQEDSQTAQHLGVGSIVPLP